MLTFFKQKTLLNTIKNIETLTLLLLLHRCCRCSETFFLGNTLKSKDELDYLMLLLYSLKADEEVRGPFQN